METDRGPETNEEHIAVFDRATGHHEALEIIVIMLALEIVDRTP